MSDYGVYGMELGRLASCSGGLHLAQGLSMNINGQERESRVLRRLHYLSV
jgi:hypothetical protein